GTAIVVAIVVASASLLSLGGDPASTPAVTGPNPATFAGLWPESDARALAEAQAAVDDGHQPLRTTADGTATLLATNLLGWELADVSWQATGPTGPSLPGEGAILAISNRTFGSAVPPITVELRRLGASGPNGVWSVVGVSTPLIELDEITDLIAPDDPETMDGFFFLSGRVTDLFDGAPAIEAHVFDGPSLVPSLGSGRREVTDGRFDFARFGVGSTPDGEATLLLTIPDATGASLGAVMVPVPTPVGDAGPTGPNLTGVPPDVAATAQRIYDAAKAKDFDALAALLDPNTFVYNLDDGSDPIPAWRADPTELDVMVAILEMPPTSRDIGAGYGTFSFWPYLVNSDLSSLSPQEMADLNALGYSDQEIQLMIDGGAGYQGPRLAIDENGRWRNFITVGE
ncbi:MAG TPA: hypothetical protein VFP13_01980, partial [Actinomycetota bacterium]|nr:hypothetical protein [Actinomycetota bacterium]